MSSIFYLIKGEQEIEIAHRHLGPDGLSVVYNSKLLRVNRSLDFLFLLICQYVSKGWYIGGGYRTWTPVEFYNEFKKYRRDHRDLVWHDITIGIDGTYWDDLTDVH